MNTRFIRFLFGAMMFFFAISEFAIVDHTIYGHTFFIPFFIRATLALGGAYLLINVIQNSDEP